MGDVIFVHFRRIIDERASKTGHQTMRSEELNREFLLVKDAAFRYAVTLLHDSVTAEDLTQDLYEKLYNRRLLIRSKGFRSLVMTSMRNMCMDTLRKRHRAYDEVEYEQAAGEAYSPPDYHETGDIIRRLIAELPEREREIIHLRDCEQMEFEDICEIVGTTESAARMALSRARTKVKTELLKIMNYGL